MKSTLLPRLILIGLIALFTVYFSVYTIRRYETLHAYTADLSLIDQAMWNTLHGRFLEATWGDHQQPRLAEHFEPVLLPLAALFWLWDDVRILLVAQALALALGAVPIYWLAKQQLAVENKKLKEMIPLVFPLLYLLSPPLQAAAVADFHADPFVVAPFLLAFWHATQKQWGRLWFWAVVVMTVKENMPTLVVLLGLYLVIGHWSLVSGQPSAVGSQRSAISHQRSAVSSQQSAVIRKSGIVNSRVGMYHGLGLIVIGVIWFAVATFGVVAPLAREYFATAGPVYLSSRFSANPLDWPGLLREADRWRYLGGLLATTGGLALLAPQYLLLGLPIFIANTFSNFPGQYSGEQHYSAPLVAVLMIAAMYGAKNLFKVSGSKFQRVKYGLLTAAVLLAGGYQALWGWTPLSRRTETYAVTAHTQILPRLLAQVPPDVAVSASAGVHPHLAHRPVAYTFPTVKDARFILADVTDVPGVHPNDVRAQLNNLLTSGQWQLLDAADGFILLKKSAAAQPPVLPEAFFSFARANKAAPQHPLNITFGGAVRLIGFDVLDKPYHRQTSLKLYWQALSADLPAELRLWPQFFDDAGQPLTDPRLQPAVETVWYPPEKWQAGEIIATRTLPQNLGRQFSLAAAVVRGDSPADFGARLTVSGAAEPQDQASWAVAATFKRPSWALKLVPPGPPDHLAVVDYRFEGGLSLTGIGLPAQPPSANEPLAVVLAWQTDAPVPVDYTIFAHLVDAAGNIVAQADAQPVWVFPYPTTRWQPGRLILHRHTLNAPLPAGTYRLRLGLYNWQTLERLKLAGGADFIELPNPVTVTESAHHP